MSDTIQSSYYWTTKSGKALHISEMSTSHIKNCMRQLANTKQTTTPQFAMFAQELALRDTLKGEMARARSRHSRR